MRIKLSLFAALLLSPLACAAGPVKRRANLSSDIFLDAQLGPYPVSIYEHEVKTSRPDPLAPTPQLRRLMVTIYRPFLDNSTCPLEFQTKIPYVPQVVAAALLQQLPGEIQSNASSIFAPLELTNCSRFVPPSSSSGPLLFFSPGYGGTHHIYASTLQAAASSGYTVVAIDHTWEAAAVIFPDGFVAYQSPANNAYDSSGLSGENFLLSIRSADAVSVLDVIERGEVPGIGSYSNSTSSTNSTWDSDSGRNLSSSGPLRAIIYGHSFGGSTAVNVAASDSRVLAAASIEGPDFYGPVANGTVRKPLLMMQAADIEITGDWPAWYSNHVRGWKTWVRPNGTVHYAYTDLPLLADLLGIRNVLEPAGLTGTVDSRRLQEIVWRYTVQFFDYVFKNESPGLLLGKSADFPDVEFVGHADAVSEP